MIHKWLEIIATSKVLVWFVINVLAPLDRRLLLATTGRLSLTGSSTVLLVTTGAKSGQTRYSSLPGLSHNDEIVLLASKGGAPVHPAWYHNIVKNPEVELIKGGVRKTYRAEVTEGETRQYYWQWLLEQWSGFAAYEKRAAPRVLPVIVLKPE